MVSDYAGARAYLDGLIRPLPTGSPLPRTPAQWVQRLTTMRWLLESLGNPQRTFATVHVAGTSGKGSTAASIAAMLQAAGYRAGLHTSPYLQSPREKMQVNGEPISPEAFTREVNAIQGPVAALARRFPGYHTGYVQVSTALALQYFAHARVDVAVIEASLGGRFDFTNVVEPQLSVITNIGYDHEATLGPGIEHIAWHKAGIIKPGTPVVTAVADAAPLAAVIAEARARGAPVVRLGEDFWSTATGDGGGCSSFDWHSPGLSYPGLECGLPGAFQVGNAALGVAAVVALGSRGFPVPEPALRAGLRLARLPGRFEAVQQDPPVVIDVAHNAAKAQELRRALDAAHRGLPVTLVLGVGAAKDAGGIIAALAPRCRRIICTEAHEPGKPALPAAAIATLAARAGVPAIECPDPLAAVALALSLTDGLVCIAGSLYLAGRVRGRWSPSIDAGLVVAAPVAAVGLA